MIIKLTNIIQTFLIWIRSSLKNNLIFYISSVSFFLSFLRIIQLLNIYSHFFMSFLHVSLLLSFSSSSSTFCHITNVLVSPLVLLFASCNVMLHFNFLTILPARLAPCSEPSESAVLCLFGSGLNSLKHFFLYTFSVLINLFRQSAFSFLSCYIFLFLINSNVDFFCLLRFKEG